MSEEIRPAEEEEEVEGHIHVDRPAIVHEEQSDEEPDVEGHIHVDRPAIVHDTVSDG